MANRQGGAVEVRGGLWGADLLTALAVGGSGLPKETIDPQSYGLPKRAASEQAARGAWTLLTAAWEDFIAAYEDHVQASGSATYGPDDFTWSRWTRHLLTQLGFVPVETPKGGLFVAGSDESDRFPITHLHAGQVVVHAVPAGAPLDSRSAGVHGAARQSPHSLVQDYLNRAHDHLWAVVTNGLVLRVLRDNLALTRQAYVEFDLRAVMQEGSYAQFSLLWHAVHATRFIHPDGSTPTGSIAEVWQQHAAQVGVAALDDLREGVERAVLSIGEGLLQHPANASLRQALADPDDPFDADALYRELLYVAYRHVFWFALDDRQLLHPEEAEPEKVDRYRRHYSSEVLRSRARRHVGGRHPDAWHHFQAITRWFGDPDGCHDLGIPPLLGALWEAHSTPHLAGTSLTNRAYFEALRRLAFVARDGLLQRINYEAMGSEELGAVYESLLEIVPRVDINERRFHLSTAGGNQRKSTGSYYTPASLIARTLDDAVDPVVEDRLAAVANTPGVAELRAAREAAILSMTVCDPSMGSAHFLVAAGMRLARHLATVRTGEVEPPPASVQQAFRDVASRCLYGIDINPMAVELAKVAIWLEAHVPGQPLTFLDHHLKVGNAILGVGLDPQLIDWEPPTKGDPTPKGGIPDAAFKALQGDDSSAASRLKSSNKERRRGKEQLLGGLFFEEPTAIGVAARAVSLRGMPDTDVVGLAAKRAAFLDLEADEQVRRERLRADAWTACWVMPKTADQAGRGDQPHDVYYDCRDPIIPADDRPAVRFVRILARRQRFFHWFIEFPDIVEDGGFTCLVGNPPWERIKIQTEEWFANAGREDIAEAKPAAKRNKLIAALEHSTTEDDIRLWRRWEDALRAAAALSNFTRGSGRFPLGGVGDVNLYALFADHMLASKRHDGSCGFLCPVGLVVGDTYSAFLRHLVSEGELRCAWTFENEEKLFPAVHNETKFAIIVLRRSAVDVPIRLTGYVRQASAIDDVGRSYELTRADIVAINPNSGTLPLFRHARSAEVTLQIHRAAPVLVRRDDSGTVISAPWETSFLRMFDMANDSGRFVTAAGAERRSAARDGPDWVLPDASRLRPLYEGKMFWIHDHRYGTYDGQTTAQSNKGVLPHVSDAVKDDADYRIEPNYWIAAEDVRAAYDSRSWDRDWVLAFRDIGPKERTFVITVAPAVAFGDKAPLLLPGNRASLPLLVACLGSLVVDFSVRQKTSSGLKFYIVEQLPVVAPEVAGEPIWWEGESVLEFVRPRIVELSHTNVDTEGFAADCGLPGRPFRWDPERRAILQAELDALMLHLYGLSRSDAEWIIDSFEVLRKYEERACEAGGHGEFRTRRLVLERYDAMSEARLSGEYRTPLEPAPADASQRHR